MEASDEKVAHTTEMWSEWTLWSWFVKSNGLMYNCSYAHNLVGKTICFAEQSESCRNTSLLWVLGLNMVFVARLITVNGGRGGCSFMGCMAPRDDTTTSNLDQLRGWGEHSNQRGRCKCDWREVRCQTHTQRIVVKLLIVWVLFNHDFRVQATKVNNCWNNGCLAIMSSSCYSPILLATILPDTGLLGSPHPPNVSTTKITALGSFTPMCSTVVVEGLNRKKVWLGFL